MGRQENKQNRKSWIKSLMTLPIPLLFFWFTANYHQDDDICRKGQESEKNTNRLGPTHACIRGKWVPKHNMGDERKSNGYLFLFIYVDLY